MSNTLKQYKYKSDKYDSVLNYHKYIRKYVKQNIKKNKINIDLIEDNLLINENNNVYYKKFINRKYRKYLFYDKNIYLKYSKLLKDYA